jgi:hypothetical protein
MWSLARRCISTVLRQGSSTSCLQNGQIIGSISWLTGHVRPTEMLDRGSRGSRSKSYSKGHDRYASGLKPQHQCHQKAKVSGLDPFMSEAPKRPSQRGDPKRPDVEAGVQRPKSTTRKPRAAPKKANTARTP